MGDRIQACAAATEIHHFCPKTGSVCFPPWTSQELLPNCPSTTFPTSGASGTHRDIWHNQKKRGWLHSTWWHLGCNSSIYSTVADWRWLPYMPSGTGLFIQEKNLRLCLATLAGTIRGSGLSGSRSQRNLSVKAGGDSKVGTDGDSPPYFCLFHQLWVTARQVCNTECTCETIHCKPGLTFCDAILVQQLINPLPKVSSLRQMLYLFSTATFSSFRAFCLCLGEPITFQIHCPYTEPLSLGVQHTIFPPSEIRAPGSTFTILPSWSNTLLVKLNLPPSFFRSCNSQTCFSSSSCSYLYFLCLWLLYGYTAFIALCLVPAYAVGFFYTVFHAHLLLFWWSPGLLNSILYCSLMSDVWLLGRNLLL